MSELPENTIESNIAVVLTDIIGSTKFVQKNGAIVAAQWFGVHDRAVMNFIARHNGRLVDASDGHLMYFASVSDAIAFAFDYKKFLRIKKFPFKSRIGIHWDKMLIVKSPEHIVRSGGKRINLEGIGKNIAARTMSICEENQILMSHSAYIQYKSRTTSNRFIPKDSKIAFVGLYSFKGVAKPERVYAAGILESHIQPPASSEKAKRLGGKKKVKVRLRNKKIREILWWFFIKFFWVNLVYIILLSWNFLSNRDAKVLWGVDLYILRIFEFLDYIYSFLKHFIILLRQN